MCYSENVKLLNFTKYDVSNAVLLARAFLLRKLARKGLNIGKRPYTTAIFRGGAGLIITPLLPRWLAITRVGAQAPRDLPSHPQLKLQPAPYAYADLYPRRFSDSNYRNCSRPTVASQ